MGQPGPHDRRGILYPLRLPTFHRIAAPPALTDRVRWFWIPRWRLAEGESSRQTVLPFPASNLVVEPGGATLVGPTTGVSVRVLSGTGWAVGALLRPAAIALLHEDPRVLRDRELPFVEPEPYGSVAAAMNPAEDDRAEGGDQAEQQARTAAVAAFSEWADRTLRPVDDNGRLANRVEDVIADDRSIVSLDHLADRLSMSVRTVQRLTRRYVGLAPLAMIRRYRLQEAAAALRADPTMSIGQLAADLGYADHAHLSSDFRTVLGFTPSSYRSDG